MHLDATRRWPRTSPRGSCTRRVVGALARRRTTGFFEERRQEQAARAKLAELTRQGREEAALDVCIPGRVFRWLDDGAPEAPHSLFEIAILATLADAFENGRPPGRGASFEGDTLVLPEGFEFAGCEWPNDGLRAGASIGRLAANGLLRVEKDAGMLRVTLPKH